MKKFRNLLILGVCVAALSFTSCKKDYTCTCTTTVEGLDPVSYSATLAHTTKSDATAACDEGDYSDGTTTIECEIE